MWIPPAVASASDAKDSTSALLNGLLPIQLEQYWLAAKQVQHRAPIEHPIPAEARINRLHKIQIVPCIHGPSQVAIVRRSRHVDEAESLRTPEGRLRAQSQALVQVLLRMKARRTDWSRLLSAKKDWQSARYLLTKDTQSRAEWQLRPDFSTPWRQCSTGLAPLRRPSAHR